MYFPPLHKCCVLVWLCLSFSDLFEPSAINTTEELSTVFSAGAGIQEPLACSYEQIERPCGERMSAVAVSWPLEYVSTDVQNRLFRYARFRKSEKTCQGKSISTFLWLKVRKCAMHLRSIPAPARLLSEKDVISFIRLLKS